MVAGGGQPQARAPSNPSVSSVIFWMESWSCLAFWTCTSFCDISLRQAAQLARAPWLPLSDRTVWDVELQNSARPGELLCPALSPLSALFEFEAPSRAFDQILWQMSGSPPFVLPMAGKRWSTHCQCHKCGGHFREQGLSVESQHEFEPFRPTIGNRTWCMEGGVKHGGKGQQSHIPLEVDKLSLAEV